MATIDEIVTRIARRCRRKATSGSNFHTEILDELTLATAKLEESPTLPWFLLFNDTFAAAANDDDLSVLSDFTATFIRFADDEPLTYVDPTGEADENVVLVQNSELLILKQRYPGTGEIPKEFTLDNDIVYLRPSPTQAITYKPRYYRRDPTAVAASATTLWSTNFSDLLSNMAGKEIAWSLRDTDAFNLFKEDLVLAQRNYIRAVEARAQAGQSHEMGDP